jgi:hypothetical protein
MLLNVEEEKKEGPVTLELKSAEFLPYDAVIPY